MDATQYDLGTHKAMNLSKNHAGPSISSSSFGGNRIWSLDIPKKVRLLIWSAYRNVVSTKDNLHKKHVDIDLECPMCGVEREFVFHCFMTCSIAPAVWLGCPLILCVSKLNEEDFATLFDSIMNNLEKEQLELFYLLCWNLWNSRNDALWNNKGPNPHHIIEHSLHFQME
ncbi:hypothetical protein SLE2022_249350 [Rubroshorea leprosula]